MPSISAPQPPALLFSPAPPLGIEQELGEISALIGSLLIDAQSNPVDTSDSFVLEALTGGRSGAHIFKATPVSGPDHRDRGAPLVVKLCGLEEGAREKSNYEKLVRPLLPEALRPDLLGFAKAGQRAALCYSFAGNCDRPESLSDRLGASDMAALEITFSTIFEGLCRSWYSADRMAPESDLGEYYLHRYFGGRGAAAQAEKILYAHASRFFQARLCDGGYSIGGVVFPSICEALFSGQYSYHSCIIHGDLNSDNILIDRTRQSAQMVDFQRTGRGHIYQDLVSIEASVRINCPSAVGAGDIMEIERLIALDEPGAGADPYARAISRIREAARYFGPGAEPSTYPFAVAAVGLRLMRATDISDVARARISASTLWAAKKIFER